MKKMSFAGPWITDEEVNYVAEAARNGWYENCYKYMEDFEKEVREYFGVKYAIGTHCCTQALHLAAASLELKAGDEVIVTDHSWVATAYAITYTGAKCIFVDIDPQTLCISPKAIASAITPKTKAIMLVHNFGIPADMDEILEIAQRNNLKVIEDAAPALGAKYKGKKCGTMGDVGCISFQGAKIAAASEGGVLITNNEEIYNRASLLASMGRTDRVAPFWSDELGYQYTIGSLPAAMATIQLRRIEELVENKRRIYCKYSEILSQYSFITMVKEKDNTYANYTYPSIWISDDMQADAREVVEKLKKDNIFCRPAFPPMSNFPIYSVYKTIENPVVDHFQHKGIVLPAAHNLSDTDIEFICERLIDKIQMKNGEV